MPDECALLVYANPKPALKRPSGGYIFRWKQFQGANKFGMRIKKFRMEEIESDRVEGQLSYDQKIIAPECGMFINDILT